MTYRYAIVSGVFTGLLAGAVIEALAWLVYIGRFAQSALSLAVIVGCLLFVRSVCARIRA